MWKGWKKLEEKTKMQYWTKQEYEECREQKQEGSW